MDTGYYKANTIDGVIYEPNSKLGVYSKVSVSPRTFHERLSSLKDGETVVAWFGPAHMGLLEQIKEEYGVSK